MGRGLLRSPQIPAPGMVAHPGIAASCRATIPPRQRGPQWRAAGTCAEAQPRGWGARDGQARPRLPRVRRCVAASDSEPPPPARIARAPPDGIRTHRRRCSVGSTQPTGRRAVNSCIAANSHTSRSPASHSTGRKPASNSPAHGGGHAPGGSSPSDDARSDQPPTT
jgi:hypothetical protein